jgi:hypothetical protein
MHACVRACNAAHGVRRRADTTSCHHGCEGFVLFRMHHRLAAPYRSSATAPRTHPRGAPFGCTPGLMGRRARVGVEGVGTKMAENIAEEKSKHGAKFDAMLAKVQEYSMAQVMCLEDEVTRKIIIGTDSQKYS